MFKLNCTHFLSPFISSETYAYASLAIMAIFVIYILVFYRALIVYLGAALLIVGGFLNASERLKTGCVKDYFNFFNTFSFNAADILVTLGIIIIIFGVERYENRSSYRR